MAAGDVPHESVSLSLGCPGCAVPRGVDRGRASPRPANHQSQRPQGWWYHQLLLISVLANTEINPWFCPIPCAVPGTGTGALVSLPNRLVLLLLLLGHSAQELS